MTYYQAAPHRLYRGKGEEMIHFDEESLNLTAISSMHSNVIAAFADRRTREDVITAYSGDSDVSEVIDELIELGIVKEAIVAQPPKHVSIQPTVRAFRIVLTEACNLKCAECFVTKNADRLRTMSRETLEEIIRATAPFGAKEQITYHFFGGEPLLRFEEIKRALEIVEETVRSGGMVRPVYAITTNATIMTDEIIAFFKAHDFKVGVSVDGPEEINDRLRAYGDGRGSFKVVQRHYRQMTEAGIDCHVLVTPHPDYLDALPKIFRSLLQIFPMKTITVNTPFHFDSLRWTVPGEKYAELLIELLHIAREFHVGVDSAASPPLAALAGNMRREGACASVGDKVMASVGPDGTMSFCAQKWLSSLTVPMIANAKPQPTCQRASDCLACEARNVCGGPCPAFQRISGSVLDPNRCDFMRSLLKNIAANLDLFEDAG